MTAQYNDLCELALGYSKPVERQSQQFRAVSNLAAHTDLSNCFRSGSNDADSGYWMRGFPYRAPAPSELKSSILKPGKGVDASSEHVDCTLALGWPDAATNSTHINFRTSATDHFSTETSMEDSSGSRRWQMRRLFENRHDGAQLQLEHYSTNYSSLRPDAAPSCRNHLQCPYWHQNGICAKTYVWAPSNIESQHPHTPPVAAGDGARICAHCKTTKTPLWRNGPKGPKSLCNACGIRYKKEERRFSSTPGKLVSDLAFCTPSQLQYGSVTPAYSLVTSTQRFDISNF